MGRSHFLQDKFLQLNLEDQVCFFHRERNNTNIAVDEECVETTENQTEEKTDVGRSTKLRKRLAWMEDYVM